MPKPPSVGSSLLAAAVAVGCGASAPPPPPPAPGPLAGHWKLESRACQGRTIVVARLDEYLDLTSHSGTWTVSAPGCRTVHSDLHVVDASGGMLLTIDPMGAACAPDPCAVAVPATIDGRAGRTSFECPPRIAREYAVAVDATTLTMHTAEGDCTVRFARSR